MVPAALAIAVITAIAIAVLGWQGALARSIGMQVHLDHCTGRIALRLKEIGTKTDSINTRIRWIRAAITAASLAARSEVVTALKTALELQRAALEIQRLRWTKTQVDLWSANFCDGATYRLPIAGFPYTAELDDAIGLRPWRLDVRSKIKITAGRRTLLSIAEVFPEQNWHPRWVRPSLD